MIVEDALLCCDRLKLDSETIFRNTLSCYDPNAEGESCGKCGACNDRMLAFVTLQIEDSIKYE